MGWSSEKPSLSGRYLTRSFGSGSAAVTVLHEVSLQLYEGEVGLHGAAPGAPGTADTAPDAGAARAASGHASPRLD